MMATNSPACTEKETSLSACTWCAFRAACWFDEKRDKPRYLRKITPEEFWQTVDREVEHHG